MSNRNKGKEEYEKKDCKKLSWLSWTLIGIVGIIMLIIGIALGYFVSKNMPREEKFVHNYVNGNNDTLNANNANDQQMNIFYTLRDIDVIRRIFETKLNEATKKQVKNIYMNLAREMKNNPEGPTAIRDINTWNDIINQLLNKCQSV